MAPVILQEATNCLGRRFCALTSWHSTMSPSPLRITSDEALAYNSLVIAWPELSKLALAERTRSVQTQHELF